MLKEGNEAEKNEKKETTSWRGTPTIDSRGGLLESDLPNEFSRRLSHPRARRSFTFYSSLFRREILARMT